MKGKSLSTLIMAAVMNSVVIILKTAILPFLNAAGETIHFSF